MVRNEIGQPLKEEYALDVGVVGSGDILVEAGEKVIGVKVPTRQFAFGYLPLNTKRKIVCSRVDDLHRLSSQELAQIR